jgi:peroxiredoxin
MILNTTRLIGWKAKDVALGGIDGKTYSFADVRGPKGVLVVFTCNHWRPNIPADAKIAAQVD